MNKPKVTIITPIYNVEKYIERCAVSLFEQNFENIEYIFVNDCTPDNSVEVLEKIIEKYPNRKPNIKIIHHEENKGSGATRKTGIENATGKYTIQIDSDDWVELDMISALYNKAKETDADIVCCNMVREYSHKKEYFKTPQISSPTKFITEIIKNNIYSSLCTKLIKRILYTENNIYPPKEISLREDGWIVTRLLVFAKQIAYVDKTLYHYINYNQVSITTIISEKHYSDMKFYAETTEKFLKEHNLWEQNKNYFYAEVLSYIAHFTIKVDNSVNCEQLIDVIYPKANKLKKVNKVKYLWYNQQYGFTGKIKFSLEMLGLHRIVKILLYIQRNMLKV